MAAAALLVLLAGATWWAATQPAPAPEAGDHWVAVMGPGGPVANGTAASVATPLAAVQALASQRGFGVEVEDQPWIGAGCTAKYVVAIAGSRQTTSGGWNYYVREPGGAWAWRSAGAGCYALGPGEQVEWCWVESDVCRQHVA